MPTPPSSHAPNHRERRRSPRYSIALDVSFGPLPAGASRLAPEQMERTVTIDLSLGGLCLYSARSYPISLPVYCVLTVPGASGPFELTGTVAWYQKVDWEDRGYKLGIEFGPLAAEQSRALTELLEHPPAQQAAAARRVLLVDDDDELRLALKVRFEASGFEVLTAGNGLEALKKGREEHPHLIILDLMLPQLNGFEVCRLLKYDQKFRHIPIILFTARCRREDVELGQSVGADAYVTKPFNGTELIAKVDSLLKRQP